MRNVLYYCCCCCCCFCCCYKSSAWFWTENYWFKWFCARRHIKLLRLHVRIQHSLDAVTEATAVHLIPPTPSMSSSSSQLWGKNNPDDLWCRTLNAFLVVTSKKFTPYAVPLTTQVRYSPAVDFYACFLEIRRLETKFQQNSSKITGTVRWLSLPVHLMAGDRRSKGYFVTNTQINK
jgi:hypothetical protein